nr:SprT family zinc-dependent metalloprotease [Vibrio sp. S11_S32]
MMAGRDIPAALLQQINQTVQHCMHKAEQVLDEKFDPPSVHYNVRGKVAGKAYLQSWEIRLNPTLLLENQSAFLHQVIPHEIAHLLTYHQFGRVRPHGKEWQAIMLKVFQLNPDTRHQFDVSSVQGRTFSYQCQCRQYDLSIRRHNKVMRNQAQYHCLECKQQLQLKSECN